MKPIFCFLLALSLSTSCGYSPSKPNKVIVENFKNQKTWKLIPDSIWLTKSFVEHYNRGLIEETISFEKNTWINGDFDGDGFLDEAGFQQNKSRRVALIAYHLKGDDFKKYVLENEGFVYECCLGIGLSKVVAGEYLDIETGQMIQVKNEAIKYSIYGKSEFLYYFDGERYQTIMIGD